MDTFWITMILGFLELSSFSIRNCCCQHRFIRALADYPAPWRPVAVPAAPAHLISIASFDTANTAQLAQIAHHNAHILRHIKGLNPPVTQYRNPYPMYIPNGAGKQQGLGPGRNSDSMTTTNLIQSSSNVANTIMPHLKYNQNYVHGKPSFYGKSELNSMNFFNSIHTSTPKIPGMIKSFNIQPKIQLTFSSTTSRIPIVRDVTLTPPPQIYRATQQPHHVVNKLQTHLASASRNKVTSLAPNNVELPSHYFTSYPSFGQAAHHIIRDSKPKLSPTFINYPPLDKPFTHNYASSHIPSPHLISNNNYPPGTIHFPQTTIYHSNIQLKPIPPPTQHLSVNSNNQAVLQSSSKQQEGYLPPLPTVPPNILTPFFQQVQQQQQQQIQKEKEEQHQREQQQEYERHQQQLQTYREEEQQRELQQQYERHQQQQLEKQAEQQQQRELQQQYEKQQQQLQQEILLERNRQEEAERQHQLQNAVRENLKPKDQQEHQSQSHFENNDQHSYDINHENYNPTIPNDRHKQHYNTAFESLRNGVSDASNFKAVDDEFTLNLVPPPHYKHRDSSKFRERPQPPSQSSISTFLDEEHKKALEILNKYNIPAISPLQDASRYSYNSGPLNPPSTATTTTSQNYADVPSRKEQPNNAIFTTPATYKNSKHHYGEIDYKLPHTNLHSSFRKPIESSTGSAVQPTTYIHEAPITHNFFTIEDAITSQPHIVKHRPQNILPTDTNQIEDIIGRPNEEHITEVITSRNTNNEDSNDYTTVEPPYIYTEPPPQQSSTPPPVSKIVNRPKIRRRRPKPTLDNTTKEISQNINRIRPNSDERQRNKEPLQVQGQWESVVKHENNRNRNQNIRTTSSTEPPTTPPPIQRNTNYRTRNRVRPLDIGNDKPQYSDKIKPTIKIDIPEPPTTTLQSYTSNHRVRQPTVLTTAQTFLRPTPTISNSNDDSSGQLGINSEDSSIKISPTRHPINRVRPVYSVTSTNTYPPTYLNEISMHPQAYPEQNSVIIATKGVNEITTKIPEDSDDIKTNYSSETTWPVLNYNDLATKSTTERVDYFKDIVQEDSRPSVEYDRVRQRQRVKPKEHRNGPKLPIIEDEVNELPDEKLNEVSTGNDIVLQSSIPPYPEESLDDRTVMNIRLPIIKSSTQQDYDGNSVTVTTTRSTRLSPIGKYESKNRPRFSVKDYRQRLSTTTKEPSILTVSTETPTTTIATTRLRFPTRNRLLPDLKSKIYDKQSSKPHDSGSNEADVSSISSTEKARTRFSPNKDRYNNRIKSTTEETNTNQPPSKATRRPGSTRRDFANRVRYSTSTTQSSIDSSSPRLPNRNTSIPLRRPQNVVVRQRIQNYYSKKSTTSTSTTTGPVSESDDEKLNDFTMDGKVDENVHENDDMQRETAIMKIAKDDHSYRPHMHTTSTESNVINSNFDLNSMPSEHSERVAELTISGNHFNSVNMGTPSRRIPGYFTIATEDPILPIEAFFPQVKRLESGE